MYYARTQFPDRYHNGAFAAFRRSFHREEGVGYKNASIPFNNEKNRAMSYYENFLYGFHIIQLTTYGLPVGLLA